MTDQKQIEEIAKLICRMPKKCDDCWQYECQAKYFAKILYNAGYRKADDVRKETAKEVLGEFYLWIGQDFDDIPDGGFIHIMKEDFKRRMNAFYKRYGMEVEE